MRQVIELAEYGTERIRSPEPTPSDIVLAERLMARGDLEARIEVRWLARGMVDIVASSWVGVVRFSALEIRVVPKLVGGTLRVLQMLEYAEGVRLLRHLPADQQIAAEGGDLFQLIVILLVAEVRNLLRDGLIRDYRTVDDTLTTLRGRLRLKEQFLNQYGSFHRVECSFDEYDGDIPENQLLAAALTAAAFAIDVPSIRTDVRLLAKTFADVCNSPSSDPAWYSRRIHYGRRNTRYRSAHQLAMLVLQGLALDDLYNTAPGRVTAFMLDMNAAFERFITQLVSNSIEGQGLQISTQQSFQRIILDDDTGLSYGRIRPDLLLLNAEAATATPIDIKYKLYSRKKLSPEDIYQTFLYAHAVGSDSSTATAGLIYPSTAPLSGPRLRICKVTSGTVGVIRGEGFDVPGILENLANGEVSKTYAEVVEALERITGLSSRGA